MKTDAGSTVTHYVGGQYQVEDPAGTPVVTVTYIFGGQVIATDKDGTVQYVHVDHLGSPVATTSGAGAVIGTAAYYPFGEISASSGAFDTERGFTGQIADAGTGLNFYNARYQDPVLGRFISPDSIVPNPASPGLFNRFAYVSNNPLRYTDPTGFQCKDRGLTDYAGAAACGLTDNAGAIAEELPKDACKAYGCDEPAVPEIEYYVNVNNPDRNDGSGIEKLFPTDADKITVRFFVVPDGECLGAAHCAFGRGVSFTPPGDHINYQEQHLTDPGVIAHEVFHHVEQGGWTGELITFFGVTFEISGEAIWFRDYIHEDIDHGYDNNPFEDRARVAQRLVTGALASDFRFTITTIKIY